MNKFYKSDVKFEINLRGRQKKKHPIARRNNPKKRFCLEW